MSLYKNQWAREGLWDMVEKHRQRGTHPPPDQPRPATAPDQPRPAAAPVSGAVAMQLRAQRGQLASPTARQSKQRDIQRDYAAQVRGGGAVVAGEPLSLSPATNRAEPAPPRRAEPKAAPLKYDPAQAGLSPLVGLSPSEIRAQQVLLRPLRPPPARSIATSHTCTRARVYFLILVRRAQRNKKLLALKAAVEADTDAPVFASRAPPPVPVPAPVPAPAPPAPPEEAAPPPKRGPPAVGSGISTTSSTKNLQLTSSKTPVRLHASSVLFSR